MHNIFIIIEKYCDLNPEVGVASALSNFVGSANASGIVNPSVFHYDEYLIQNNKPIDDFLIDNARTQTPEALLLSYYPFENDPRNVSTNTISAIKEMGIPVILTWCDMAAPHIRDLAIKMSGLSSLSVVVDIFDSPNEKFLPMWSPQDESLYTWEGGKDIDVSFAGSINNYSERNRFINFLQNKVNLLISGGQREHRLTIEQYADIFKRSKISLNFPSKQSENMIQAKGRIFESMLCGSLLLEKENNEIKHWFEPFVHYVPFDNEQDLLDKINYYLDNAESREEIVKTAYNKVKESYSNKMWWERVLSKARSAML